MGFALETWGTKSDYVRLCRVPNVISCDVLGPEAVLNSSVKISGGCFLGYLLRAKSFRVMDLKPETWGVKSDYLSLESHV